MNEQRDLSRPESAGTLTNSPVKPRREINVGLRVIRMLDGITTKELISGNTYETPAEFS